MFQMYNDMGRNPWIYFLLTTLIYDEWRMLEIKQSQMHYKYKGIMEKKTKNAIELQLNSWQIEVDFSTTEWHMSWIIF